MTFFPVVRQWVTGIGVVSVWKALGFGALVWFWAHTPQMMTQSRFKLNSVLLLSCSCFKYLLLWILACRTSFISSVIYFKYTYCCPYYRWIICLVYLLHKLSLFSQQQQKVWNLWRFCSLFWFLSSHHMHL